MEVWLLIVAVMLVSLLYPNVLSDIPALLMMLPVLGYTLWFYIDWQLASFADIALSSSGGVIIGLALFAAGLPINTHQPHSFLRLSLKGLQSLFSQRENLGLLTYQALFIFYEELIWRVFLTHALLPFMSVWLVIPLAASLFWYVHEENRSIGGHSVEFLLFSLALTAIYIYSGSLLLVLVIHGTRNLLILSGHDGLNASQHLSAEEKNHE